MTLDGPDPHDVPSPGTPPPETPRDLDDPAPRDGDPIGWRNFVALGTGAVLVLMILRTWPPGSALDVDDWAETIANGGAGEAFALEPVVASAVREGELEERAGIRWVDIRISLLAGRPEEADSMLAVLGAEFGDRDGTGEAARRIEELTGADLRVDRRAVEEAQDALAGALGPGFEEAVVLESLRRAARTGLSDLAYVLANHPLLRDGVDEDLQPAEARRIRELADAPPSTEEMAEIQEIVAGVLRRRAN